MDDLVERSRKFLNEETDEEETTATTNHIVARFHS